MFKGNNKTLVSHRGIFRRQISLWEGVALIVSATIGAGVLSIPYAVSRVGLWVGLLYIIGLGFLMMGLNLLVGEIAVRTKKHLQLVGFAKKYLGKGGEWVMLILSYTMAFGILTIYIIGEGETFSVLFGGSSFWWSIIFWVAGSCLVVIGLRTIKTLELVLTFGILLIVLLIAVFSFSSMRVDLLTTSNLVNIFLPYGVILFALAGTSAIPEVETVLENRKKTFKKAIIIAGFINIFVYILFTVIVVGVTGENTTEIATIGLGEALGQNMLVLGNLFAIFAMGTSFLLTGLALKDSLSWDFNLKYGLPSFLVMVVPIGLFLLGVRSFIVAIDVVGGVFMSLQMLLLMLIYWRAKQKGDLPIGKYRLHHSVVLVVLLITALLLGTIYSVSKLI